MRFIQSLRMPDSGLDVVLPAFQRQIIRATYSSLLTVGSLPSGNGKTGLMGLIALERLCRGDPYGRVVVLATKHGQAREVVEAAKAIGENDPRLVNRLAWYEDDAALVYRPSGATLVAHSARLKSIEGLRYRLALIDEIGFALDELVTSILARLGKGALANRILGMGTPGFSPNVLYRIDQMARDGAVPDGLSYLKWAAPDGCDVHDERAFDEANPAVAAGFLSRQTRELQLALMPELQYRVYHLGQWVGTAATWLPSGAWADSPHADAPADGSEIVLALAGTWRSSIAVVGATLDGSLFMVFAVEVATDDELADVFAAAAERWRVTEVVIAPRVRANLVSRLAVDFEVSVWSTGIDLEVTSATEWRRAIVEGRVAHDHDPVLEAHVSATVIRSTVDGQLRLTSPDDGRPVDAARAARMAWTRARELADTGSVPLRIY